MAGVDRRTPIRILLATAEVGANAVVDGWIKTSRFSKNVSFLHLYDGSTPKTVQVVLKEEQAEMKAELGPGAAVRVTGTWVESKGGKQALEILAEEIVVVGEGNPTDYPIQRKQTSMEFLRTVAHLRPRTNTFQSVFRVRNALAWQVHKFFQDRGFLWIHTPIITASDAEGAGEMFRVQVGEDKEGFFGKEAFLTVSGQLAVENFAQAFTDVYTFGPTFRAENSNTARHAAEFWMIEPEIAFADLDDDIALAEDFIRTIANETIAQCREDFDFFDLRIEKDVSQFILETVNKPFARITHDEAQDLLAKSGRKFEHKVGRGEVLQTEHERFLAEEHFKGPVFVTDYPVEQKAFYMRLNDDERTVAATDLLVPRIGEIIGGSQREERLDVLKAQLDRFGLEEAPYWWYMDLRRFGTTPHAGFGLGFERMLMWITGMKNIRDVLPFPRTPGQAEF
ncbi:MAG: asparagine--tRNA ligase [Deltaproteobacteria bacterium]|nr:MAG: asparagine--tRNA ligase [Deltaproteobacteria bacterium]